MRQVPFGAAQPGGPLLFVDTAVYESTVSADNDRNVVTVLHASFDFKGRHACRQKLAYTGGTAQILQTERITLFSDASVPFADRIRQAAGLGTGAAIAAAAAHETAHEALTRIRHTRRTMNEDFHGKIRLRANGRDFRKAELPCQDDLRKAQAF